MTLRRSLIPALIPAIMLVVSMTATAVGVPSDKVDVCHRTGSERTVKISVSENALPAHLRHGDVLADEYGDCP